MNNNSGMVMKPFGVFEDLAGKGNRKVFTLSRTTFLATQFVRNEYISFFAAANLILFFFTLCPIPSIDGWVIWGEIFGFRKRPAPRSNEFWKNTKESSQ
ncbi:MAG: hypothetical protein V1799_11430 [bacterium]